MGQAGATLDQGPAPNHQGSGASSAGARVGPHLNLPALSFESRWGACRGAAELVRLAGAHVKSLAGPQFAENHIHEESQS